MFPNHNHPPNSARIFRPTHYALVVACLTGFVTMGSGNPAHAQGQRRPAPQPRPVCLVADFRSLALQTHEPGERAAQTLNWLRANGSACTAAQLGTLASNRAAWLGNADSPALMGMIDGMLETLEAKQSGAASIASLSASVKAATSTATESVTSGNPPPRIASPNSAATPVAIAPIVVPVALPSQAPASTPRP